MSTDESPKHTTALLAAHPANPPKPGPPPTEQERGKTKETLQTMERRYGRLLGLPEFNALDQKPGTAIHLYKELMAPYETPDQPAPPLLAMHFRDLARLQLELEAWELIRDAEMEYRSEQIRLEFQRCRHEMDRDLDAFAQDLFKKGLCRVPDCFAKLKEQSGCLVLLEEHLKQRDFSMIKVLLERLYGKDLWPEHERGQVICGHCRRLLEPERHGPLAESDFNDLLRRVEAEEHDALEAQVLAQWARELTTSASRARLAPTRQDHWMNRQGDRLRQAIDRKMQFTPLLLKVLGLAQTTSLKRPGRRSKKANKRTPGKPSISLKLDKLHQDQAARRVSQNK